MPFLVDASVTASWFLPDEMHGVAAVAFQRLKDDAALAPSLWWFEMRNMFLINERRGRLSSEKTGQALERLEKLPIEIDDAPVSTTVLSLARKHRLTVYDAAYLELAQRAAIPLATLDDALMRAARAEHVVLVA